MHVVLDPSSVVSLLGTFISSDMQLFMGLFTSSSYVPPCPVFVYSLVALFLSLPSSRSPPPAPFYLTSAVAAPLLPFIPCFQSEYRALFAYDAVQFVTGRTILSTFALFFPFSISFSSLFMSPRLSRRSI